MRCVVYTRDASGILVRTHRHLDVDEADRTRTYPHGERLLGWPERAVFWSRASGAAVGVAPLQ